MSGCKTTVAVFQSGAKKAMTAEIYQYAQGQVLQFEGLDLPVSYRVDFSNEKEHDYSKPQYGSATGVNIPDEYLLSGKPVYAFVVLSEDEDDVATEYMVQIPVRRRPRPTNYAPTEVEMSVIDQVIAAAQAAEAKAESSAEDAEAWAVGERDGEPVESDDPTYENNSKHWAETADESAESAGQSATDAAADALKAEGYAVGTQDGTPVGSGSPYYENNASYYSGLAREAQRAAETSEENAEAWAAGTRDGTPVASGDPAYHNNGAYYLGQTQAAETQALQNIGNAASTAVDAVGAAATQGISDVGAAASAAVETVENAGDAAAAAVNGDAASSAKKQAIAAVQQEGRTQVQAVEQAADAKIDEAEEAAEDSEAWAVGTRGGEPVPSSDPAYRNNAKYIAEHIYVTLGVDDFFSETSENPQQNKFLTSYMLVYDEDENKTYAVKRSVVDGYLVETFEEVTI